MHRSRGACAKERGVCAGGWHCKVRTDLPSQSEPRLPPRDFTVAIVVLHGTGFSESWE